MLTKSFNIPSKIEQNFTLFGAQNPWRPSPLFLTSTETPECRKLSERSGSFTSPLLSYFLPFCFPLGFMGEAAAMRKKWPKHGS